MVLNDRLLTRKLEVSAYLTAQTVLPYNKKQHPDRCQNQKAEAAIISGGTHPQNWLRNIVH